MQYKPNKVFGCDWSRNCEACSWFFHGECSGSDHSGNIILGRNCPVHYYVLKREKPCTMECQYRKGQICEKAQKGI